MTTINKSTAIKNNPAVKNRPATTIKSEKDEPITARQLEKMIDDAALFVLFLSFLIAGAIVVASGHFEGYIIYLGALIPVVAGKILDKQREN